MLGTILDGPAGVLKINVNEFPALLVAGGSILLKFSGSTPHPLLINRGAANAFYAMDSDCQHNHCVVNTYDASLGVIRCGCHGSRYAIDGSLLGGPATRGLNTFASTFDGANLLSVTIPGLKFSVTEIGMQTPAPALRLRLTFDILPYSRYQIYFQEDFSVAPQVIAFATTPSGPASATSVFTTVSPATAYVDANTTQGFYTVALVAETVQGRNSAGLRHSAPVPPVTRGRLKARFR